MDIFRRLMLACIVGFLAVPTYAANPGKPAGAVVLTVGGAIDASGADDGVVRFDRDMLQSLDWREVETFTSFTRGPQRFAGPTLASLLQAVNAQGVTIRATAINDYAVEFPLEHAFAHDVILAMDHNGNPMRVRDKGPIWIIYPLSEAEAARQKFDAEMIWQLDQIMIK